VAASNLRVLAAIVVIVLVIGAGAAANATAPRQADFGWAGYAALPAMIYSTFLHGTCGARNLETGSPLPNPGSVWIGIA